MKMKLALEFNIQEQLYNFYLNLMNYLSANILLTYLATFQMNKIISYPFKLCGFYHYMVLVSGNHRKKPFSLYIKLEIPIIFNCASNIRKATILKT